VVYDFVLHYPLMEGVCKTTVRLPYVKAATVQDLLLPGCVWREEEK